MQPARSPVVSDPIALRGSRELHKRRCCEIALTNTSPNVRVVRVRKSLTGKAYLTQGILAGPKPFYTQALYIFLHECAHFARHGFARHVEELKAEQWARGRMREAGMSVPPNHAKERQSLCHPRPAEKCSPTPWP
jgi:hypothetical protein